MTTTYRITGRTNEWIAQRDATFKGKTEIIIANGLSLKEAQKKLMEFFCEDYEVYMSNWGLARIHHPSTWSNSDGTRGYEYDSRYFEIELEDEE